MGVIGDFLTGRLREEMKSRVDQILNCGNEWNKTARELTQALNKLADVVQQGSSDAAVSKSVARSTRRLAGETAKLTKAFEDYKTFLGKVLARFG